MEGCAVWVHCEKIPAAGRCRGLDSRFVCPVGCFVRALDARAIKQQLNLWCNTITHCLASAGSRACGGAIAHLERALVGVDRGGNSSIGIDLSRDTEVFIVATHSVLFIPELGCRGQQRRPQLLAHPLLLLHRDLCLVLFHRAS